MQIMLYQFTNFHGLKQGVAWTWTLWQDAANYISYAKSGEFGIHNFQQHSYLRLGNVMIL